MDATELIIKYAVPAVLNKAIGGPTPIITGYHKAHFVILAKAIQESNRDQDIQKTLAAIRDNLGKIKEYGVTLIKAIPPTPEPPSADVAQVLDPTNTEFGKQVEAFAQGVTNILNALRAYIDAAEDILKRTKGELAKVEKNLNMKGAKWAAMRQISNAKRLEEIQFIQLREMEALSRQVGSARSLYKAYENI